MQLNVSQRKSAIFDLFSTIAKFLADKLLLYKKNDGYGFHEENIRAITVKETKIGRFAERPTPIIAPYNFNFCRASNFTVPCVPMQNIAATVVNVPCKRDLS